MSQSDSSKVRLGAFIVAGSALGCLAVFAFGGGRFLERTTPVYCYFEGTVQGLEPGADIRFHGVKLGRVVGIKLRAPNPSETRREPMIRVEGELVLDEIQAALVNEVQVDKKRMDETLRTAVDRGLRATLALRDITGQKYIDVDFHDPKEYPPPQLGFEPESPHLPTATGASLSDIQKDLATTASRLAEIDFGAIGARLDKLLETATKSVEAIDAEHIGKKLSDAADGVNEIASGPQIRGAVANIEAVTARLAALVGKPETERCIDDAAATLETMRRVTADLEKRLPQVLERADDVLDELHRTVVDARVADTAERVRTTLESAETATRKIGGMHADVSEALREFAVAVARVGRLADTLERHPEALIAGRKRTEEE